MPRHEDNPCVSAFCPQPNRVATDELLTAAGRGSVLAFGAFYDRTSPAIFGFLRSALRESGSTGATTEGLTKRVYVSVWREAPRFDPTVGTAFALLLSTARRELIIPAIERIV